MRKIYITKEDLVNEIETASDKLFNNKLPAGPFTYLTVAILIFIFMCFTFLLILSYSIVLILYIPGYILDYLIIKFLYKGKTK